MIKICKLCNKDLPVNRQLYCSNSCKVYSINHVDCKCGKTKTRYSKNCKGCNKRRVTIKTSDNNNGVKK